ncbi:hypothetical protein ACF07Y_36475 [Streptomyces sp. NPDC016566]|uniref:hypothetical protein n=1 Tax=Streptomyces sp. NPDC016566 TaxID=3364967 RepID=UPI0036F6C6AF
MEAEVSAGWIGLIGASVGAAGALLGGWLQQRSQARIAKKERHEQRAVAAGDTSLMEMLHLQRQLEVALGSLGQHPPTPLPYRTYIEEHSRAAEVALLRMPDAAALRHRMKDVFAVLQWFEVAGRSPALKIKWALAAVQDGVELLSAFLRDEPLPAHGDAFLEHQAAVLRHMERARLLAETDGMMQDDD